jgi:hypothetical protein
MERIISANVTEWRKQKIERRSSQEASMKCFDKAEALFCRLDEDQRGYLTYKNLEALALWLIQLGRSNEWNKESPTYAEVDEAIDYLAVAFDVHLHDGRIDLEQFVLWYEDIECSRVLSANEKYFIESEIFVI